MNLITLRMLTHLIGESPLKKNVSQLFPEESESQMVCSVLYVLKLAVCRFSRY